MEIERKFLVSRLPDDYQSYPCLQIEQGYLNTHPVVRVRRQNEEYYLTYKSGGFLAREEYNLPLNKESYDHLICKADGFRITKRRYLLPLEPYTIELDVFEGVHAPLIVAEVEFPTKEEALRFTPPEWFGRDVSQCPEYANSYLSRHKFIP